MHQKCVVCCQATARPSSFHCHTSRAIRLDCAMATNETHNEAIFFFFFLPVARFV